MRFVLGSTCVGRVFKHQHTFGRNVGKFLRIMQATFPILKFDSMCLMIAPRYNQPLTTFNEDKISKASIEIFDWKERMF